MDPVTKGFYDAIVAAAESKIAKYGNRPAVVTSRLVPENIKTPYVYCYGNTSSQDSGTKNSFGREIIRDVNVYVEPGDPVIDQIVSALEQYHRHPELFTVEGRQTLLVDVSGPTVAPTDDTLEGISLTFRIVLT